MIRCAEEERLKSQPRKNLISSVNFQNGTLLTRLLSFYLELGLVCIKLNLFVEYTPEKKFFNFVQVAVDAWRQGDQNPNSCGVAETLKLLAKSFYAYQRLDPVDTQ